MAQMAVKLDTEILNEAKIYGNIENRSVPKQIEYWIKIGKIAQDNPDLTFEDIKDILLGKAQIEAGMTKDYNFG